MIAKKSCPGEAERRIRERIRGMTPEEIRIVLDEIGKMLDMQERRKK